MKVFTLIASLLVSVFLAVAAQAATATLSWTANTETDLAGYKIYRANAACATATPPATPLASVGKVTTYVDSAIPATWSVVCYWLTAFDTTGNESVKSAPVGKLIDIVPPGAPGGLQVVKATPDEVIVVASALDCPRVMTSRKGSTVLREQRTVTCVRG